MKESDGIKRLAFFNKTEKVMLNNELDQAGIIFSDQYHVSLKGLPHKQKSREWPKSLFDAGCLWSKRIYKP